MSEDCPLQLIRALASLANSKTPNWWRDVLGSRDVHIAVRGGYLNVYAKGQSIFKIGSKVGTGLDGSGTPLVAIYYKYLLEPRVPRGREYIRFDGHLFAVEPRTIIATRYEPEVTLPKLIEAALRYAGEEKEALHVIVERNPTVIDLEIAFTRTGDALQGNKALRMDLVAVHPENLRNRRVPRARLVFYEAKRADDKRLRAGRGRRPAVVEQLQAYDNFLRTRGNDLVQAYTNVCRTLIAIGARHGPRHALINEIAANMRELTVDPVARLLIFGFDQDQREGSLFAQRIRNLQAILGPRVVVKGSARSFALLKDSTAAT